MSATPSDMSEMPELSLQQPPARITVLSGGVGGARFLQGVLRLVERTGADTHVTVVANTADDIWVHGLKVCPDLDTVMYTLGNGIDQERGWGRTAETWNAKDELAAYGVEPTWFGLGDRDIATHLVRTQMLEAGYPLSDVTAALCRRWLSPIHGAGVELLPMTDERVETHVVIDDPDSGERRAVHFQEYWIRHQAAVPAHAVVPIGIEDAKPGPGVLEAIADTDVVLVPPSNPVVSVGTILGVPGVRDALLETSAPVVGVSGIIGEDHVRGMARQLLGIIGVEVSAAGVAEHYGARANGGVLDGWLVDTTRRGLRRTHRRHRPALPRGAAVDDRPRRHGRHGRRRPRPRSMTRLEAWPVEGVGEVDSGTDLPGLVAGLDLEDGDVVLVTSKVVSKAEGRVRVGDREEAIRAETVRVVARRGPTSIVENHLGLVMAAAGVDASNVTAGSVVLLPVDPDASARAIRQRVYDDTNRNVAVVITDTAGRAWRTGQTDLAVGVAGLEPLHDFAGSTDSYGNDLAVTAPAVADELASLAELVTGKLGGRPVSIVRGLSDRVLPVGEDGPGAVVLLRPREQDMFALGAREAVLAAVRGDQADCFGSPAPPDEVLAALETCGLSGSVEGLSVRVELPPVARDQVAAAERVRLVAHAHGWRPQSDTASTDTVTISPARP